MKMNMIIEKKEMKNMNNHTGIKSPNVYGDVT
jgi:hypothetical protein